MLLRLILLLGLLYAVMRVFRGMGESPRPAPKTPRRSSKSPHEVLGVSATATQEEIRAAYQKMVQQYHPDRVADLGDELQRVAERRTKEINAAYTALKRHG